MKPIPSGNGIDGLVRRWKKRNLVKTLRNIVDRLESTPFSPWMIFFMALVVGSFRPMFEASLEIHANGALGIQSVLHNIVFYFAVPWLFLLWLPAVTGKKWEKVAVIAVLGMVAGFFPPLIDWLLSGLHNVQYTYMPRFKPFFVGSVIPRTGIETQGYRISAGEAADIWFVILSTSLYVYISSASILRGLISLPLSYLTWQFIGTILFRLTRPLTYNLLLAQKHTTSMMSIYFLVTVFLVYWFLRRSDFPSLLKRSLHPLPFALAVIIAGKAGGNLNVYHFFYAVLFYFAGVILVIQNDYFDMAEDSVEGRSTGVSRNDVDFLFIVAFLGLMSLMVFQTNPATALLAYFSVWTLYHHPSTRLKKIPLVPYLTEGLGGLSAGLAGLAASALPSFQLAHAVNEYTVIFIPAVFAGFTAGSIFKDYKDIDGDDEEDILTFYVLGTRAGFSAKTLHFLVFLFMSLANVTPVLITAAMGAPIVPSLIIAVLIPFAFFKTMMGIKNRKLSVEMTLAVSNLVLFWLAVSCPPLEKLATLIG